MGLFIISTLSPKMGIWRLEESLWVLTVLNLTTANATSCSPFHMWIYRVFTSYKESGKELRFWFKIILFSHAWELALFFSFLSKQKHFSCHQRIDKFYKSISFLSDASLLYQLKMIRCKNVVLRYLVLAMYAFIVRGRV